MADTTEPLRVDRALIDTGSATLETFRGGAGPGERPLICAAHPASAFGPDTVRLLAQTGAAEVLCINPRGLGGSTPSAAISLEQMVDDIERVRTQLELRPWIFWGMSGGGWLAQLYARRHPDGLAGIVVESACLCFRERLADPGCALSPFFPAWRAVLAEHGLLADDSHARPSDAEDAEWITVEGAGQVFRRRNGPALLVAPMPLDRDMTRAMPVLWTFDSRAWIGSIRTPALVLCGTADPVVPPGRVREVHQAIAGSMFESIEGAGHVPTAEQRPEVADAFARFFAGRVLTGSARTEASV